MVWRISVWRNLRTSIVLVAYAQPLSNAPPPQYRTSEQRNHHTSTHDSPETPASQTAPRTQNADARDELRRRRAGM